MIVAGHGRPHRATSRMLDVRRDIIGWNASALLQSHWFLHIPKTGGSSINEATNHTAFAKYHNCCTTDVVAGNPPSNRSNLCCVRPYLAAPWHIPPDSFAHHFGHLIEGDKRWRRWCLVRDPTARWASELNWNPWSGLYPSFFVNGSRTFRRRDDERLHRALRPDQRRYITWDEELLHYAPQHWHVVDPNGGIQCDCVVAFEKLKHFPMVGYANSGRMSNFTPSLPQALQDLYALDRDLHARALRHKTLCFPASEWRIEWANKNLQERRSIKSAVYDSKVPPGMHVTPRIQRPM